MSKRNKARRSKSIASNVQYLSDALVANGKAAYDGPERKKWHLKDMRNIRPMTDNQKEMFQCFFQGSEHICAHGSAGTGKTFLALYLAFQEILDPESEAERVILVRSAVPSRDMGFMPGTLEEKLALYEMPYVDIMGDLFGRHSTYGEMKKQGLIEFVSTSYVRGLTWDDAIIIVDEGQNLEFHEINSIMTRVGECSRVIFTGDLPQTDLRKKNQHSGMEQFLTIIESMENFAAINFSTDDIVRSSFVREWIIASEEYAY